MTGLLGEIHAAGGRVGQTCKVELILRDLDDADATDLIAALEDDTVLVPAIVRALAARGLKVQENSLRRHRAGRCRCDDRGVHATRLAARKGTRGRTR